MKIRWGRWVRPALCALGLSLLVAGTGLREDEIDCEEAVALLQQCCPGFAETATISCEFSTGCGATLPALSIEESQCILALSCAEITARGLCEKTHDLQSPSNDVDVDGVEPAPPPPVCQ